MAKQFTVTFVNQKYTQSYPEGTLVSTLLKEENIRVSFVCNGQGTCGKCRVKISGATTPPTAAELKHIAAADLAAGIRLACQVRLAGPVQLELLEDTGSNNILQKGLYELTEINPLWGRINIAKPQIVSWEAIAKELPAHCQPELTVLQEIALLPPTNQGLTVEFVGSKIIHIGSADDQRGKFAVAVDIGTTTLAAYLLDLKNGRILNTASAYNPQGSYGADVISRINYASNQDGLVKLHQLIIAEINKLIGELVSGQGITPDDIIQVNLVGNSCMMHLLLKVSPAALGHLPFEPVFKRIMTLHPAEIGLRIDHQGIVIILPGIGGFVGSDISAGVLACKLRPQQKELFIDIGTNGEVVITGQGRMLACSTAAGPAFEGATISCGMLARPGAITDLQFTGDDAIILTTIDNEAPKGICGTGLIRAMVEMLRKGFITETGRWEEINHPNFDPEQKRFYLVKSESNPIFISQQDIRQFQLAKGAMRTGLELLLKRLGMTAGELQTVYLAGAFGTFLKPEDAVMLGLLPEVSLDRIKAVGNTAGMGAVISTLSKTAVDSLASLIHDIEHIELAEDPQFTEVFTESMLFGNGDI